MQFRVLRTLLIISITLLFSASSLWAQNENFDKKVRVALRQIGHELLLQSGDSSSKVLPVLKLNNEYRLQFENDFEFDPAVLANTISRVFLFREISKDYLVEVKKCNTDTVVYSYDLVGELDTLAIPCRGRLLDKDCYTLFVSINDTTTLSLATTNYSPNKSQKSSNKLLFWGITSALIVVVLISLIFYFKKKKTNQNRSFINIGKFQFDPVNMLLISNNTRTELTSKESELLHLLYNKINSTVEREIILKEVWNDEGDYIGRTLDVYISKLRKKLENDNSIKIINARGIGYKLTSSNTSS